MPEPRLVKCPSCNADKTTKAAQNVRLRCDSCGQPFLAPPVPDGDKVTPTQKTSEPKKTPEPRPSKAGSGVTVARASGVKVRSNAKTRKPKTTSGETPEGSPTAGGGGTGRQPTQRRETRNVQPPGDPKVPANQARSKISGRRGGVGFYTRKFKRNAS